VHGIAPAEQLPVREHTLNLGDDRRRRGVFTRFSRGPSQVKRIGHGVLMTTDLKSTVGWYRENLGFIASDEIFAGDPSNIIGSFNRADRGEEFVDHHILFCVQGAINGLQHVSFEVQDVDDVMIGHEYLKEHGYEHAWGVGRHILGSQIFDYWMDPWRRIHEHWTDGDLFNVTTEATLEPVEAGGLASQWGEHAPEAFVTHAIP
jgi:catechol 2,3-dioxygenase-like lactoylglutathione lyase family enzyme